MRKLGPDDLSDMLEQPLVAVMSTYRMDGGALLSPVWHQWRDGGFDVVVYASDIKLKHLRRDPRMSVLVYEHNSVHGAGGRPGVCGDRHQQRPRAPRAGAHSRLGLRGGVACG